MTKVGALARFELKRMLVSKTTAVFAVIYLLNYLLSAYIFTIMGSEGTVLTVGNAQSFPIQHLQASFLFTGIFVAIYVSQLIAGERTQGTIKLTLTRIVSRRQYYMSRILSIFIYTLFITLMMIVLSYIVGQLFFGWGEQLVFFSLASSGIEGVGITLLSGLAFAFAYFAFGMLAMVVAMISNRSAINGMVMGMILMVGQYAELFPSIKQFALFHQMLFFHIHIFEKPFSYSAVSLLVLLGYSVILGVVGYGLFGKKDLYAGG